MFSASTCVLFALILYRPRRFINHLLIYLLTYLLPESILVARELRATAYYMHLWLLRKVLYRVA